MKPCIFYDRDGVINIRKIGGYIQNKEEFIFIDGFIDFFEKISLLDYLQIVITNQQCIAKNIITFDELNDLHIYMNQELKKITNSVFDEIFVATEFENSPPFRRKPSPKMIFEAIEKYDIDIQNSYFIGDSDTDILAANSANIKSFYFSEISNNKAYFSSNNFEEIYQKILMNK